jgi:NAD+ kinase
MTHGKPATVGDAVARVREVATRAGVTIVDDDDAELCVVLGGDGTMLRALKRFVGTEIPVLGVNFGRVGFLTSVAADSLEDGLSRAFAGDYQVVELPTLEAEVGGEHVTAVNDAVAGRSSTIGRMIELGWSVGGEDLGVLACDGVIVSTPSGSTAYNLSNGGPVLVWGIDAMAVTFIAPHSLHARPLVVPRSAAVAVENRTPDVPVTVLVDGHEVAQLGHGEKATMSLGRERSRLATLPDVTFFGRYRRSFA